MKGPRSFAAILIASVVLMQYGGILSCGEGKVSSQEMPESSEAIFAQNTSDKIISEESRAIWELGDNVTFNDSAYLDLMELVRTQYLDDLNYSSQILDQFVKKKIDGREAMTATMTLFVLTSETVDMVGLINPPNKFEMYNKYTIAALLDLEGYLWNMIKYYETARRAYAMQAHENFNDSMENYDRCLQLSRSFLK